MKKFLALFAGLMLAFSFYLPVPAANAAVYNGTWNYNEYTGWCTQSMQDKWGAGFCPDIPTQAMSENWCDCSGENLGAWTKNGHDWKNQGYNSTAIQGTVIMTYRKWDDNNQWKLQDKLWCAPHQGGCFGNGPPKP